MSARARFARCCATTAARAPRLKPFPGLRDAAGARRELAALRSLGVRLLALGEPEYPRALARIDDAPPLISVRGSAALLDRPMVAIVGSRNAPGAGAKMAGPV